MMSIKAFAVSMAAIGASSFGLGAYVAAHPSPAEEASVDEIAPVPANGFEFVSAGTTNVEASPTRQEIALAPVTIFGRSAARGVYRAPNSELLPCSEWHSLATGPTTRHVKELCLRAPE